MHLHAPVAMPFSAKLRSSFQGGRERERERKGALQGPWGHMSTAIVIILTKVSIEAHIGNKYKRFYGFIQAVADGAYRK